MQEKSYNDTMKVLQDIIEKKDDWEKITVIIKKITYQIANRRITDAIASTNELIAILNEADSKTSPTAFIIDECYIEIISLATKFVTVKTPEPALLLLQSLFIFIKTFCVGEAKLIMLCELGFPTQSIAEEVVKQGMKDKFDQLSTFMDDILVDLEKIEDINPKLKSKQITWLMSYYCCCCQFMGNYTKSIEWYTKAIKVLEAAFGNGAQNFRLYAFSYYNMAFSYECSDQLKTALKYYKKAQKIYMLVTDWPCHGLKNVRITEVATSIQRTQNKLHKFL